MLPDTDRVTVQAGSGQLIAFGLFKSKDPFVQQLSTNPTAATSPAAVGASTGPITEPTGIPATSPASPAAPAQSSGTPNGGQAPATTSAQVPPPFGTTTPAQPSTTPLAGGSTTPASATPSATPSSQSSSAPVVAPTAVAISTNGQCENVSLNGTFPGNEDIFKLVSIAKNGKSAKIAIVGGAYDDGQATTPIQQGVKTTLVNTADGTRYVIELLSKCAGQPSPSAASSGTSTGSSGTSGSGSSGTVSAGTVAAPTVPTSTSTTPIVTDLLDALSPVGK